MDLSGMTEAELGALGDRVREERLSRKCGEFLPGHQSCDRVRNPHDEHGYTQWRHDGRGQIRVTWKNLPSDEQCQAEFIDGSWYGDDCPKCRAAVSSEMDECEQCHEEDYCPKHANGVHG